MSQEIFVKSFVCLQLRQSPINRRLDLQYWGMSLRSQGCMLGNSLVVKDRMGGITIFFDRVETGFN